ncbi:probable serine/threonine-protein kinase DDB_G0286465 [Cimex lectularius]|uniref:RFX-type winged-helix domain-containing protein n=1 Tax=Cimex lectularius TaxID=79782 RepID=A0A8I6SDR6_CIMLE|nr:probable serine/threonine-protein kinase DDB_G0286465 [Cimex lectularius]
MQYQCFAEGGDSAESGSADIKVKIEACNPAFLDLRQMFPVKEEIQQTVFSSSDQLAGLVNRSLQQESKRNVELILEQISKLSPLEKLLLYLKLPTGKEYPDPLKQPSNPLGSRPEISQTIAWIKTHLKEDKHTSLPKQDVYNEYLEFCNASKVKHLSTADFGKVMKQVYPSVRPRRLGTRGNSRYCYSGMTNRLSLPSPQLPKITGKFSPELAQSICKETLTSSASSEGSNDLNCPVSSELTFMMSSKICRPNEDKCLQTDRRKQDDELVNRSTKTPPERCKGRKGSTIPLSVGKKGAGGKKPRLEENNESGPSGVKLPIPRLPKIPKVVDNASSQSVKKQKPLQPKPANGRETEFLESGNSLEQEEELMNYFRKSSEEEPKVSQLRMLLERNKEDKCARRRVSFETVPESPNSQKKFSFVPISPISSSPFAPPTSKTFSSPHKMVQRSNSVSSPLYKGSRKEAAQLLPPPVPQQQIQPVYSNMNQFNETVRSQSVPTLADLPHITPVPSDVTDFTDLDTDSSNLLGIDESSSSLLVDQVGTDNLNSILNIINNIDPKLSRSYPNTPTCSKTSDPIISGFMTNSKSYPCTPVQTISNIESNFDMNHIPVTQPPPLFEGTINLFDDGLNLDCEDTFNDLAREVTQQLNSDVL